jgi:uncharacterized protein
VTRLLGNRKGLSVTAFVVASLPVLALVPLGLMWLWQHDAVLLWVAAATASFLVAGLLIGAARRPRAPILRDRDSQTPAAPPDSDWSAHDKAAWQRVLAFSEQVSGDILGDQKAAMAAARGVIAEVATHYRPDEAQPILQFTMPEALLLIERISRRSRRLIVNAVPGSRRLRIGHLLWLNQARKTAMAVAHTGSRVWRVGLWVLNPVAAVFSEARRTLQGYATNELSALLADRVARIVTEEIGRAAINLYSGRLQADMDELGEDHLAAPAEPPPPLHVLIAGKVNAGKSSLLNALLGEVRAAVDVLPATDQASTYRLGETADRPAIELVDSTGLDRPEQIDGLTELAAASDLVVWVSAANDAARQLDRALLDRLRARFREDPALDMPPVLVVMSHIDRLRPYQEWSPPYDVAQPQDVKAGNIRQAMEALAQDLDIELADVVPARLDHGQLYNTDAIWSAILALQDEARRGQLLRILRLTGRGGSFAEVAMQMIGAGRLIAATLSRSRKELESHG